MSTSPGRDDIPGRIQIPRDRTPLTVNGKIIDPEVYSPSPRIYAPAVRSPIVVSPGATDIEKLPSVKKSPAQVHISDILPSPSGNRSPPTRGIAQAIHDSKKPPRRKSPSPVESVKRKSPSPVPVKEEEHIQSPLPRLPPPEIPPYIRSLYENKQRQGPYVPNPRDRYTPENPDSFVACPDFEVMSEQEKIEKRVEYKILWTKFHRRCPDRIPKPPESIMNFDLYELHYTVQNHYITACVHDSKSKVRMMLIGAWLIIEIALVKGLKINAKGYTIRNLKAMETMDDAIELLCRPKEGEHIGSRVTVASLFWMSLIQLAITLAVNYIGKWTNSSVAGAVDSFISKFFSNDSSTMEQGIISTLTSFIA